MQKKSILNKQIKQLNLTLYDFIRLNPKRTTKLNTKKYNPNSFRIIKNFLNDQKYFNGKNYDGIFYNPNNSLSGKDWLNILLNSEDIFDYNNKLRSNYFYCKQAKLRLNMYINITNWFLYQNKEKEIIESAEFNFSEQLKIKLKKIHSLLKDNEWSDYFFNLQKLMHEEIIKLLDWKNKPLNYSAYSKVFLKKLIDIFDVELIDRYEKIIQKINFYRNILSKASPGKQEILDKWNSMDNKNKQGLALELYYSLTELISAFNLIKS